MFNIMIDYKLRFNLRFGIDMVRFGSPLNIFTLDDRATTRSTKKKCFK